MRINLHLGKAGFRAGLLMAALLSGMTNACAELAPRQILYVDNRVGSAEYNGSLPTPDADKKNGPYASIMQALRSCGAGARIEIANTGIDYRESVNISGLKKGLAEAPLVIDGHGAVVNGLMPVATKQWEHLRDDIYYFANRVGGVDYKPRGWFDKKTGDFYYGPMPRNIWVGTGRTGWYTENAAPKAPQIFLINGKPGPNVVKLEELPPGGFFYDVKKSVFKDLPQCIFFRLPEAKTLRECIVEVPQNSGVFVNDDYVTVQNLGSCYSVEDGFYGFWGINVVFRNIHSFNNSEQGMSFHGTGTTFVDGALIENNGGGGIVDVMSCLTVYRNVTVRNNHPIGVIFKGVAHAMYDCRIEANSGVQVTFEKNTTGNMVNCLVAPSPGNKGIELGNARLYKCTIVNASVGITVKTGVSISNSIVSGCKTNMVIDSTALGNVNLVRTIMGEGKIDIGGKPVTANEFSTEVKGVKTEGVVFATEPLALTEPLYLLSADSPYSKSGENGLPPGAHLSPDKK